MEVDNESTSGSVVNLRQKPPVKGKKKKSTVAKLVERKRRNSECGSEFGSTASLKNADTAGSLENIGDKSKQTNGQLNESDKSKPDESKETRKVNGGESDNIKHKDTEISSNLNKEAPKPVPRRLNRRQNNSNNEELDDLKGGTVVSIYDKLERAPPNRFKRDSSPSSKKEAKRELFPQGEKPGTGDALSLLGPGKSRSGLSPLGDLPPLHGGSNKLNNIELSPPVPMDIDDDIEDENNKDPNVISKNAPSDATVHRFRAMRMSPDRSKSEESLKNAQFYPKPPPTPKTALKNSMKGEKRNREANSSGEEADVEAKKQNSVSPKPSDQILNTSLSNLQAVEDKNMEVEQSSDKAPVCKGLSVHPNLKEVKDYYEDNANQNMNPESAVEKMNTDNVVEESGSLEISPDKNFNISPDKLAFESSPEKDPSSESLSKKSKNSDKKKKKGKNKSKSEVKELPSLDGADTISKGSNSLETFGSASDLKAVTEKYKEVLKNPHSDDNADVPMESILPEPSPKAGKLTPIKEPKNLPPLSEDVKVTSLRTAYKADPTSTLNKYFGRSFSGGSGREGSRLETMSQRSFSSSVHTLSTREARDRVKQGNMGSSLLSSPELDRYLTDRKVGLWVGTWNMAEIKDCKDPLDDFLLPESSEYVQDIYAIGTQENAMNKKEWEILLQETIGPSHVLFHSASHGALHLAVFVKRDLIWFCTVPEDDIVQTRAVTMVKTKGAIAISFNFFGTSLLFINCHFAAGDDRKRERLDDFTRIIKQLNLPKQGNTGSPNGSSQDVTSRFDSVFWMGDLNFRIEVYKGKQAVEDIVRSIQEQEHPNFEDLVTGDQLTKLIVEGNIFQGFQEGRINFRPTYKYDIGQNTYDTSTKNRIPSYTDRVLFRARKKNSITCTHYDSPTNVNISDHRPVFGIYEAAVKPARDGNQPLAAGQFDRAVYIEANRRRSLKVEVIKTLQKDKSSKVCSIQ